MRHLNDMIQDLVKNPVGFQAAQNLFPCFYMGMYLHEIVDSNEKCYFITSRPSLICINFIKSFFQPNYIHDDCQHLHVRLFLLSLVQYAKECSNNRTKDSLQI